MSDLLAQGGAGGLDNIMIKKFLILILIFFTTSCTNWSTFDKTLLTTGTILNGIDILQTREIFDNPKKLDRNTKLLLLENVVLMTRKERDNNAGMI